VHDSLRGQRLVTIPGAPPDLARLPDGCAFAPRCAEAGEPCHIAVPAPRLPVPGHMARCVRVMA
jgi:peptide/nickel transport system ATP-binding protein